MEDEVIPFHSSAVAKVVASVDLGLDQRERNGDAARLGHNPRCDLRLEPKFFKPIARWRANRTLLASRRWARGQQRLAQALQHLHPLHLQQLRRDLPRRTLRHRAMRRGGTGHSTIATDSQAQSLLPLARK
jgi:hypothetical protein